MNTPGVYIVCIVALMSIGHALLGLLEGGPRHGYDLKRAYDERFGQDRPLHYGQVYSTLSRLLKNGFVTEAGVEAGDGPERKRYAITDAGVTDVERWLSTPAIFLTSQVPLLTAIVAFIFYRALKARREALPFFLALGLFLMSFIGLGVSMYPFIVPDALTIWDAAAPERSQWFMLVGAAVLVPIILGYTAFSYWVFRGKTGHEGYH